MQTKANIHQSKNYLGHTDMDGGHLHPQQSLHNLQQHMSQQSHDGLSNLNGQDTECLPEENVSIVEDISNDEKLESMKSIVNGTMRRKLYFNPAYFEPHLLVVSNLVITGITELNCTFYCILVTTTCRNRIFEQDT